MKANRRASLWRSSGFMKLWAGQTVSLLGSQISLLAVPLTAILLFHASALEVGALNAVQFLPFLLFGLPVGVWVDRLPRRLVLVVADLGRFVVLGTIPLANAFGGLTLPHLYAAAFLSGTCTVFFDVAYISYLPELVPTGRLVEGNAKLQISEAGAQLAGPGLAGLLVSWLTAPVAILADSLSYLASVASLLLIRRSETTSEPRKHAEPVEVEAAEPAEPALRRLRREIGEGISSSADSGSSGRSSRAPAR